jgi:hypothetical protein
MIFPCLCAPKPQPVFLQLRFFLGAKVGFRQDAPDRLFGQQNLTTVSKLHEVQAPNGIFAIMTVPPQASMAMSSLRYCITS